jgi:fermentation-respiration switch protein FrsA (DUF1100 family)
VGTPSAKSGITRRDVLVGAVALPLLAACSPAPDSSAGVRQETGVQQESGTFTSKFWPGQDVRWQLARPASGRSSRSDGSDRAPQPLVVALHGHGGDARWPFTDLHLEDHVQATGLAVATVDGGDFYWHGRRSGIDTGRMVVQDLLPLLGRKGMAVGRIGLIGWSMGGYGALLQATRLGPRRVAGVVAASAALWQSPGDSAPGAFDDRDDFIRNDVFAARGKLSGIPVRLDCGRDDPFVAANRAFARGLPAAAATFDEGAHNEDYWTARCGAQLAWLSARLR